MAAVVVDASALVEVFTGPRPASALRQRVLTSELNAPEMLAPEMLDVLRRLTRAGKTSEEQAARAVWWLGQAPISLSPHRPLVSRVWELRGSIRPYDGTYVALAERLKIPLITCDGKLAGSNGHDAEIELYPTS